MRKSTFDHWEKRSHESSGDAVKATEVLSAMAKRRLVPNQHVYGAAIHACNRSRDAVPWIHGLRIRFVDDC